MTPRKRPYICYRGRKYRDCEHRLENTYGEGDCVRVVDTEQEEPVLDSKQREPIADDTEAKQFGEALLKSVQGLARQIEVMGQRFTAIEAR